jgi:hypothetical protein
LALPKIKNLPKRPLNKVFSSFFKEYSAPPFLSRSFMIWAGRAFGLVAKFYFYGDRNFGDYKGASSPHSRRNPIYNCFFDPYLLIAFLNLARLENRPICIR